MKTIFRVTIIVVLVLGLSVQSCSQKVIENSDLKHWTKGSSPTEVGKRVAEHCTVSQHFNSFRPTPPKSIVYQETCTWYGALTFAKLRGDKQLIKKRVILGLFKIFNETLDAGGVLSNQGKMVDASFVEAPRQRNTRSPRGIYSYNSQLSIL